jgi:hypothetical protein
MIGTKSINDNIQAQYVGGTTRHTWYRSNGLEIVYEKKAITLCYLRTRHNRITLRGSAALQSHDLVGRQRALIDDHNLGLEFEATPVSVTVPESPVDEYAGTGKSKKSLHVIRTRPLQKTGVTKAGDGCNSKRKCRGKGGQPVNTRPGTAGTIAQTNSDERHANEDNSDTGDNPREELADGLWARELGDDLS